MLSLLQDITELLLGSKRQDALRHFANKKGFTYSRQIQFDTLPPEVTKMKWMTKEKVRTIRGFLYKVESGLEATGYIIDLVHAQDFKERATTVFLIESKKINLPYFSVEPKSSIGRMANIFSSSGWDHLDPTFDKNFVVTSENINKLSTILTFQFAEEVVRLQDQTIEGVGKYLAVFKPLHKVDIIDMDNTYERLLELCDILGH